MNADVVVRRLERSFFSISTRGDETIEKNKEKKRGGGTQPLFPSTPLSLFPPLSSSTSSTSALQVVVSDVPGCGGWIWAQEQGIETRCFPPLEARGAGGAELRGRAAAELAEELLSSPGGDGRASSGAAASPSSSPPLSPPLPSSPPSPSPSPPGLGVDVVALAGYLKLVPAPLVRAFPRRMLNIHPALLPGPFGGKGFYGARVHEAVLASGARFSGPTVHFVDEAFDRGPILAQRAVPVLRPSDDAAALAARVLAAEHEVFPEALAALCSGAVRWTEGGIPYY